MALGAAVPGIRRWWGAGLVCGGLLSLALYAPASWLADAVARASHGRFLLAQAQGTLWQGNALAVLNAGAGMRDAAVLPSRLHWTLRPVWGGLRLSLTQACCLDGPLRIDWQAGWSRQVVNVQAARGEVVGHWPAGWLEGLGAPLNTLRPGGELQLSTQALALVSAPGTGWQLRGSAQVDLLQASSRLATVEPLGSYRLSFTGPQGIGPTQLSLTTLDGALRLGGQGQLDDRGLHLRGEAQAAPGFEAALNNLLNIIGRRDGALSRISIG